MQASEFYPVQLQPPVQVQEFEHWKAKTDLEILDSGIGEQRP